MRQFAAILCLVLATGEASSFAEPDETLLRGPHPFIKANELTLHAGYSSGLGDAPRGLRVQGDYSYRIGQVPWFHVQMGVLSASCAADQAGCRGEKLVDILGGITWKFQTDLPIVPYAKAGAGLVYVFPEGGRSAAGVLARGGLGAHYYFFDWFGLGVELTGAWGAAFPNSGPTMNLGSIDANLGVALQF